MRSLGAFQSFRGRCYQAARFAYQRCASLSAIADIGRVMFTAIAAQRQAQQPATHEHACHYVAQVVQDRTQLLLLTVGHDRLRSVMYDIGIAFHEPFLRSIGKCAPMLELREVTLVASTNRFGFTFPF